MSFLRTEYIKHHKIKVVLYAIVFALVIGLVIYFSESLKAIFTSSDAIREWVLSYGVFAPLALFLLQVGQVIIAPLNNFLINFAGGYIFGPYMGFLYNYFGWITGAIIVFWLCRIFGRKFVGVFISQEKLEGFDEIMEKGVGIIFLLFILPVAPDDLLVYVVGLSKTIKFRTFLWIILVGKIPGKLATSFLGAGVADHSNMSIIMYALFIIISVIVFWKKPELWRIGKKKHNS